MLIAFASAKPMDSIASQSAEYYDYYNYYYGDYYGDDYSYYGDE